MQSRQKPGQKCFRSSAARGVQPVLKRLAIARPTAVPHKLPVVTMAQATPSSQPRPISTISDNLGCIRVEQLSSRIDRGIRELDEGAVRRDLFACHHIPPDLACLLPRVPAKRSRHKMKGGGWGCQRRCGRRRSHVELRSHSASWTPGSCSCGPVAGQTPNDE
ncbi:hypothetical protein VTK56DRAFT_3552 [Thermocarpiscus australiensis]